jgi:hypothetical protein
MSDPMAFLDIRFFGTYFCSVHGVYYYLTMSYLMVACNLAIFHPNFMPIHVPCYIYNSIIVIIYWIV